MIPFHLSHNFTLGVNNLIIAYPHLLPVYISKSTHIHGILMEIIHRNKLQIQLALTNFMQNHRRECLLLDNIMQHAKGQTS